MGGDADAVIGDTSLWEIVGADLRRAVARAYLGLAERAFLLGPLAHLAFQEAGLQDPHSLFLVLELALLVLAGHDQARRLVRDPDRRVRGVHALPTRTAGTVNVHLQVALVDLHLHILGLGKYRNRRRRGVDAALALRLRHPLDAMRTALVLEDRVGPVAADLHGDFFVSTDLSRTRREGAVLEGEPIGVAGVHIVQLAGEEGSLVAACACPDLDYDVFVVVGVAVDQLGPYALGEVPDLLFCRPRLGLEELALLRVLGLGDQLTRISLRLHGVEQLPAHLGPRANARVLLGDLGIVPLVAEDVGVRKFFR